MKISLLFSLLALAQLLCPAAGSAQTIVTSLVDGGRADNLADYSSLALVDGNPALAYYVGTTGDLMFARNAAADGSGAWTVTTVARAGLTGLRPSLAVVGGKPAIAFFQSSPNPGLRLAVNANADASGPWTIVNVGSSNNATCSLADVGGKPAVTYRNGSLYFARNSAADGSGTWTATQVDPVADFSGDSSLGVSGGVPVVAYRDDVTADLKFARNTAADGSGSWVRTTIESTGNIGLAPSLATVGGVPGIAYYDQSVQIVKYAVNSVADGSGTWTIRATGAIVSTTPRLSLGVVGGNPAIAISSTTLTYLRATAANGSGAWTAVPLDSGTTVGGSVSLLPSAGFPQIAYRDATARALKLARSTGLNGLSSWSFAVVDDGSFSDGIAGTMTCSTALVAGAPGIAYRTTKLRFARANAPDGSTDWACFDVSPDQPAEASLCVVDGTPAIAYLTYVGPDYAVRFSRNDSAAGDRTWATQTVTNAVADGISLAVVAGNPALTCTASDGLRYWRNAAADGSGPWTSTLVDSSGTNLLYNSLALVAGRPAVAYGDVNGSSVKFARAGSADGSGPWTITTVSTGLGGSHTRLQVVNGNPAIVFVSGLQLYYARCSNADGSGTWTPVPVGTGNAVSPAFAVVGGYPAISFMDYFTSDLRLARNSSPDGFGQWQILTVDSAGEVGNLSSLLPLPDGRAAIGYQDGADRYDQKWAVFSGGLLTVEQPVGAPLTPLASREILLEPGAQAPISFILRNTGSEPVQLIAATLDPPAPTNFEITLSPAASLAPFGDLTVCTVTYKGITYGRQTATLRLASTNPTDNPLLIQLVSTVLSVNQDTDGDGLNDSAEYQLRALGFDWQASQPQLVATLQNGANAAGLYTPSQVQALYVGTPLVQRNAATGQFTLRFGLRKSINLQNFVAFPFVPGQTSINGSGEVEFVFGVPDNAAFFQLRTGP